MLKCFDVRFASGTQHVYREMEGKKCLKGDHMYSCDCYKLNVLFQVIIRAEERLPLLSQDLRSAGV